MTALSSQLRITPWSYCLLWSCVLPPLPITHLAAVQLCHGGPTPTTALYYSTWSLRVRCCEPSPLKKLLYMPSPLLINILIHAFIPRGLAVPFVTRQHRKLIDSKACALTYLFYGSCQTSGVCTITHAQIHKRLLAESHMQQHSMYFSYFPNHWPWYSTIYGIYLNRYYSEYAIGLWGLQGRLQFPNYSTSPYICTCTCLKSDNLTVCLIMLNKYRGIMLNFRPTLNFWWCGPY
jgi:hypothetical protein